MRDKPATAAGYHVEDTKQVVSACLTLASALGDLSDDLCIVGGLVPSMICEAEIDPSALDDGAHVGTNDLDVALEVSVLDDEHYKEIASRLRTKGFGPDANEDGRRTRQRWRWRDEKVTVDFLIPPVQGIDPDKVRLQDLEEDLAALIVKPLGLAFHERVDRALRGHTLEGDVIERVVSFCGPAAFVGLKAFAFSKRAAQKDAYDLVYVLRRWPAGSRILPSGWRATPGATGLLSRKSSRCSIATSKPWSRSGLARHRASTMERWTTTALLMHTAPCVTSSTPAGGAG